MGKHYVPQFYLRSFCEGSDSSFIWTYFKGTERKFFTNIINIAQENKYYTDETEKFLSQKIESPTKSVIEKIKNYEPIPPTDRKTLAEFMSVLLKRVPHGKERAIKMYAENFDTIYAKIESRLSSLIEENPSKRKFFENSITELKSSQKENKNHANEIWEGILLPSENNQITDVLYDMTWLFLVYRNKPVFLTNDNPIFWFESIGVGKQYSEVSFPISPNITLWATWRGDFDEGYFPVKDQVVYEINRRTTDFATKFIFSPISANWISHLVKKTTHKLNLIDLQVENREIFQYIGH